LTVTGIEIDPLTARIAKALYPDADIRPSRLNRQNSRTAFTTSPFPMSRLAITPFTTHVSINYKFFHPRLFLCRRVGKSSAGGLLMFITSRGTMDKLDSTLRELLSTRTELLGAIRLPTTRSRRTPARKLRPTS